MKKGFTMFLSGKDYFFNTTCKSTNSKILLEKICKYFDAPVNDQNFKFLRSKLSAATLEFKKNCTVITTNNGQVVTPYNDNSTVIVNFTQKNRTLATKENIEKIVKAINFAKTLYMIDPDKYHVTISVNNNKMDDIPSVSIVPFVYCPACAKTTCGMECYAFAMALNGYHPDILKSWAMNTVIALYDIDKYFAEISDAMTAYSCFRYHVSGEILHYDYFDKMVKTAIDNPKTDILVFTKNYQVVNEWIDKNGDLPGNMHLLFSGWEDKIVIDNPHNLPETNVLNECEKPEKGTICKGNCFYCKITSCGCWKAGKGERVYFEKH